MGAPSIANLGMTAGKPFAQSIRITDANNLWDVLETLEVRAQLRAGKSTNTELIVNLHEYMTWVFDEDDLVITWVMTGEQTREIYELKWGPFKTGYFNVIVSDTGTVDERAIVVPTITLTISDTTTMADGEE
jgi:hypothetical protein